MNLRINKTLICLVIFCLVFSWLVKAAVRPQPPAKIVGIFWQPDLETQPAGNWDILGAKTFVPQFGITNGKSWFPTSNMKEWEKLPNWEKVQTEPWAKNLILGLSGDYNEVEARAYVVEHGKTSLKFIQQVELTRSPQAYYFPVEADPTWLRVSALSKTLQLLPKPLWVSIYSNESEPLNYTTWVESWLPQNTNVFLQDGVGTGVRTPQQAIKIAQNLQNKFGKDRVVIILEAFRHNKNGEFRAAYPWEIIQQLKAYEGQNVYIFDGPHYVNKFSVYAISVWQKFTYS